MLIEKIKKFKKKTFGKIFPSGLERIDRFLIDEIKEISSCLDLGCGGTDTQLSRFKRIKKIFPNLYSVGVDIFDEYIEKSNKNKVHSKYIKADILEIDFPNDSFDCILLMDVVEHLEKDDFIKLIPKLEKWSKKVIILTPNGFTDNDMHDGNEHQIHKSGWKVQELENLGFKCSGVAGFKFLRTKGCVPKIKPSFLGNMICDLTEPFVQNNPRFAYHLLCIKKQEEKREKGED